jgi:hypothetical protein
LKIAVIGGGIFGATAAIHCAHAGHEVHLFDKADELMMAASNCNQLRLHEGYHYPRSPETAKECRDALVSFCAEYSDAIVDGGEQYYAIAERGSRLTGMQYLDFCQKQGLDFEIATPDFLDASQCQVCISVVEGRIDPVKLRTIIKNRLKRAGVKVHLNAWAHIGLRDNFNAIVIAAYANTNNVAVAVDAAVEPFQFEVVEKPVFRVGAELRNKSVVIMDGEFCSLDPLPETDFHLMGHVAHAIHATNDGLDADIPVGIAPFIDQGVMKPKETRVLEFMQQGSKYIPALKDAEWQGSMFTVRAVLPDRDVTDERPTLVHQLDEQVIRVFSGKIPTAVSAAQSVLSILDRTGETASAAA